MPARPMNVCARAPSASPSRVISASPRVISAMRVHGSWAEFRKSMAGRRMYAFTTAAGFLYTDVRYAPEDMLVFGTEATGLSAEVVSQFAPEMRLRLPMRPGNRSLNLSNAVAVAVFEAWRQLGFPGGA